MKANLDVAPALPHVFQGHQKVLPLVLLSQSGGRHWTPKTKQENVILFDLKVKERVRARGIKLRRR